MIVPMCMVPGDWTRSICNRTALGSWIVPVSLSQPPLCSADLCHLPSVCGSCKARFPRFFYNWSSQACEEFVYGGCGGNKNNFETKEECLQACRTANRSNPICNLPADPGPCFTYSLNYFYNSVTKRCEEFVYGGCQGNGNRFDTMFRCLKTCGSSGKTAEETQLVGSFAESPCSSSLASLYSVAKDICKLPVEPGSCQAYMTRYFYNSATKKCEMFRYGGCQGNKNRFATKDQCLKTCGQPGILVSRKPKQQPPSGVIYYKLGVQTLFSVMQLGVRDDVTKIHSGFPSDPAATPAGDSPESY
uniref:BPTI/Kunitz inhibitor domain-containing protein n=1 Tax=Gopherus evgoodei TaxID=1825980 RepID=A0A8C4XZH5_9SAUR